MTSRPASAGIPVAAGDSSPSNDASAAAVASGASTSRWHKHSVSPTRRPSSQPRSTGQRWRVRLFRGMTNDIRRRAPYYWSDWTDAWDYRVVPATVYMYFANILPALAFSLDMFTKTNMQYGVNEVLLASVLGAVVFSFFACQPLVIVGVTGPITVFNYTVYDIMSPTGTNYLAFMCWIGFWSLLFHWILAITNSCNWLRWVTRFPCDIFGFYVAFIYLQKGIQVLERLGEREPFYLSVTVALLVFMVAFFAGEAGQSRLFTHAARVFLKDYGTPLTVVFFSGFVHLGRMRSVPLEVLPTGPAFLPTLHRSWLVDFWNIRLGDVFLAIPFAILLTVLFYFDHNVSSLIAQGTEFPLRKPAGFHWDIFLLGLTTGVAGILGLPFPNGLIPQAPFHTESLCVTRPVVTSSETKDHAYHPSSLRSEPIRVVEQRLSNLSQGLLTLATMAPPLLAVLHLIPHGVLAGLFFVMGVQALQANGITAKLAFLLGDAALVPPSHPLRRVRRTAAWAFVGVELLAFAATFAITQTIAAVGFPVFILLLIPIRAVLLPRLFKIAELGVLDAPAASDFTMESVGGSYGGVADGASTSPKSLSELEMGVGVVGGVAVGGSAAELDNSKTRLGGRGGFWSGEQTAMPSEAASILAESYDNGGNQSREDLRREAKTTSGDVEDSRGLRGRPSLGGGPQNETRRRDGNSRRTPEHE